MTLLCSNIKNDAKSLYFDVSCEIRAVSASETDLIPVLPGKSAIGA
jgi:hypothetical protein